MSDYKYRELDYAILLYQDGLRSPRHIRTELRLVATYMRRVLNYKPKRLREEFYHWCETHIDQYNQVLHYKLINTAIRAAVKKDSALIQLDSIPVYQPELDYIMAVSLFSGGGSGDDDDGNGDGNSGGNAVQNLDYHCRKLLFTLMCQLKINSIITQQKHPNEDYVSQNIFFRGNPRKFSELKKIAALPESVKIHEDVFYHLYCSGLISLIHSGIVRLDFMNQLGQIPCDGLDPVLNITEFEICGWYFDLYNKKQHVFACCGCGKLFRSRTKNSNQKYCSDCRADNPYFTPVVTKMIRCCNCGEEHTISSKDNQTKLCQSCYTVYRRQYKAQKEKERRERKKQGMDTTASLHEAQKKAATF